LDLCTGSGCIGLAIASRVNDAKVTLADVSKDALAVAKKNIINLKLSARVSCVQANALEAPSGFLGKFDLIVSNPPYVSAPEYAELEPTVRNFEPKLALVGGETGVEIVARIVAMAPDYLKSDGKIFVEMSPTTADETARLFEADGRWLDVAVLQDFAKLDRFVSATLK
jgi:release factor glutamine methyltransferase